MIIVFFFIFLYFLYFYFVFILIFFLFLPSVLEIHERMRRAVKEVGLENLREGSAVKKMHEAMKEWQS